MSNEPRYDWVAIRAMYEAGDSLGAISRVDGMPSKAAIHKRAKKEGWVKVAETVNASTFDVIPFTGITDTQRMIVMAIADGATQRLAAQMYGVHETTISDWKRDSLFSNALLAAKAAKVKRRLAKIDDSQDWRAAGWLLERDPDSRDEFMPPNAGKAMISGSTFNVLGHVNLGFDRSDDNSATNRLPSLGQHNAPANAGSLSDQSNGVHAEGD